MRNVIHTSLSREQCRERLRGQTDPWPKWWERLLARNFPMLLMDTAESLVSSVEGDRFRVAVWRRGMTMRAGFSPSVVQGTLIDDATGTQIEYQIEDNWLTRIAGFPFGNDAEDLDLFVRCLWSEPDPSKQIFRDPTDS